MSPEIVGNDSEGPPASLDYFSFFKKNFILDLNLSEHTKAVPGEPRRSVLN